MTPTFGNYIGGRWLVGTATVPNVNPSDLSDIIGAFTHGDAAAVDTAVAAAKAAFPAWSRTVPFARHAILKTVAEELYARRDELGRLLSREEGKILADGVGEVTRAAQVFEFFAAETLRVAGELVPSVRPDVSVEVTREAVGVVGVITPWNFPMAIPAWKIAPALAYGNCVVFKPAELVPASAHALSEIIARAGLPDGVFNLVVGRGATVGQRLVEHPDIAAVSFTGSVATGGRIARSAVSGETLKKVQLEMGGKSPLVILDDADIDKAVDVAINGAFYATGQRCTASSRLIVTKGVYDRVITGIKERLKSVVVGDALEPGTQIGPVVDQAQLDRDLAYVEIGKKEGARLECGGERLHRRTDGFYFAPALFTDVTSDMKIVRDEIFGPVACAFVAENYEEALAIANDTSFGLSSGICTTSLKHANHFKRNIEAGLAMVNMPTSGVDFHVPFGGRKASSYGPREQGSYAREFYTQIKTAYTLA